MKRRIKRRVAAPQSLTDAVCDIITMLDLESADERALGQPVLERLLEWREQHINWSNDAETMETKIARAERGEAETDLGDGV